MSNIKVYPQFMGRLGNNLFQIAACIGYAKRHNCDWGIMKGYIEPGFKVRQVDEFMPWLPAARMHFQRYNEPHFDYREIPHHPRGARIVGFWQSLKYFEHCQQEVKDAIRLPIEEGSKEYCSIHARRGDYIIYDGSFPPVTIEYFKEAIPIALAKGYKKFLVFSDGIEWCEEVLPQAFPDVHFEYSKSRNEWQDLSVMASCGANIIANSSFSWWGAYLNPNPDKFVISPDHTCWFGWKNGVVREAIKEGKEACIDIIPNDWIRIKFR